MKGCKRLSKKVNIQLELKEEKLKKDASNSNTIKEDNVRIAKNTLVLYLRMFFMIGIIFLTSREVLTILGVTDYGIYSLIAGIVVLFSFINGAIVNSTQRYLNFYLGLNNVPEASRVFSMSLNIYAIMISVILIVGETIGYYLFKQLIVIPESRTYAAEFVYHTSIAALILGFIKAPYNACILAHEKMVAYAVLSIFDVILKLGAIWTVLLFNGDKLLLYSAFTVIAVLGTDLAYILYTVKKFDVCKYKLFWDKKLFTELSSFSGWNILGSSASVGVAQGANILVNIFFGVTVNAAVGISNQVLSAVYSFSASFQAAFNPQIVKLYAKGKLDDFRELIYSTSSLSYYLLLLVSIPLFFFTQEVLEIWLVTPPKFSVDFTKIILAFSLVEGITAPLWMAVYASGKIKHYQITISVAMILTLPITYFFFKLGYGAIAFFYTRLIISCLLWIFRVYYLQKIFTSFKITSYIKDVVIRCGLVTLISSSIMYISLLLGLKNLYCFTLISFIVTTSTVYSVGISREQRNKINNTILNKYGRPTKG